MDEKKLIDLALELGFADAAVIDTDRLVFVPAFRTLCEENQCGKYGVSGCSLCDPCAITTGEPCRFPKMQCSCMSAYCIFVKEMTDLCHMDYECAPGITTFFSMYCFDLRTS